MTAAITSPKTSNNDGLLSLGTLGASYSDSISNFLLILLRAFTILVLLALFAVSLILWIWIASFRSGWEFWVWANEEDRKSEAISASLLYGFLILLISPFVVFFNWTQNRLAAVGLQLPDAIPIGEFLQEQLGINVGNSFPFASLALKPGQKSIQSGK